MVSLVLRGVHFSLLCLSLCKLSKVLNVGSHPGAAGLCPVHLGVDNLDVVRHVSRVISGVVGVAPSNCALMMTFSLSLMTSYSNGDGNDLADRCCFW